MMPFWLYKKRGFSLWLWFTKFLENQHVPFFSPKSARPTCWNPYQKLGLPARWRTGPPNQLNHNGSMGLCRFILTWMVDVYGFHVGKNYNYHVFSIYIYMYMDPLDPVRVELILPKIVCRTDPRLTIALMDSCLTTQSHLIITFRLEPRLLDGWIDGRWNGAGLMKLFERRKPERKIMWTKIQGKSIQIQVMIRCPNVTFELCFFSQSKGPMVRSTTSNNKSINNSENSPNGSNFCFPNINAWRMHFFTARFMQHMQ